MNYGKPDFFKKSGLFWLFSLVFALFLGSCNPFDDFSDCPKLIGAAKVGSYRIEKVPTSLDNLSRFHFVDSLHGYAFQNFQRILRTKDGGKNWEATNLPITDFSPVHFFSKDSGFVSQRLFDQKTFAVLFLLFKTVDGGQSAQIVADTFVGNLNQIHFFDENNGWASGQIELFDSSTMSIRNEYGLYSTKNGGKNWRFHQEVVPGFGQDPMRWVNNLAGYYLSQNGVLFRTTDGGENWEALPWQQFLTKFPSLRFVGKNFGYTNFVAQFDDFSLSEMFFTEDGGENWQLMTSPENLVAALDLDENGQGLFVAKSTKCGGANKTGFFAPAQNGTEFDETNPLESIFQWESIHFGDPNRFFVALNGSQLLKVTRE